MRTETPAIRVADPRAVLVTVTPSTAAPGTSMIVVGPMRGSSRPGDGHPGGQVLVDGEPVSLYLDRRDAAHAVLFEGEGADASRSAVVMLPVAPAAGRVLGVAVREVIVDGWRIEVEIESAQRAALRERARIGRGEGVRAGPTEIRATIPGRVLSVKIAQGDAVVAGQPLVVVEAMKMQNELRAPRDGVVTRVAVARDQTIEVGDLLLVLA